MGAPCGRERRWYTSSIAAAGLPVRQVAHAPDVRATLEDPSVIARSIRFRSPPARWAITASPGTVRVAGATMPQAPGEAVTLS